MDYYDDFDVDEDVPQESTQQTAAPRRETSNTDFAGRFSTHSIAVGTRDFLVNANVATDVVNVQDAAAQAPDLTAPYRGQALVSNSKDNTASQLSFIQKTFSFVQNSTAEEEYWKEVIRSRKEPKPGLVIRDNYVPKFTNQPRKIVGASTGIVDRKDVLLLWSLRESTDESQYKSLLTGWSPMNMAEPLFSLVSYGEISCAAIPDGNGDALNVAMSGHTDGLVSCWDLCRFTNSRGSRSLQETKSTRSSTALPVESSNFPSCIESFSTDRENLHPVLALCSISSSSSRKTGTQSEALFATLDAGGMVSLWKVLRISSENTTDTNLSGLIPGSQLSLFHLRRLQARSFPLRRCWLISDPEQQDLLYIGGAEPGSVLVVDRNADRRTKAKTYSAAEVGSLDNASMGNRCQTPVVSFSPHHPSVFLFGSLSGSVQLFHKRLTRPVAVWDLKSASEMICLIWDQNDPSVFFTVYSDGAVIQWKLDEDLLTAPKKMDQSAAKKDIGFYFQAVVCGRHVVLLSENEEPRVLRLGNTVEERDVGNAGPLNSLSLN